MGPSDPTVADLQPDLAKLKGDSGDIYLLQFLSTAENAVNKLDVESLQEAANDFHALLLDIITAKNTDYPAPGRPVRRLISRILVSSVGRLEARSLSDLIFSLSAPMADLKAQKEVKIACFDVCASLIAAKGSQIISLLTETITNSVKTIKSSQTPVIISHAAIICLQKALTHAGHTLPEPMVKDILKTLKSTIVDKSLPLQRASAQCLLVAYQTLQTPLNATEIDSIITLVLKPLQTADIQTRRSLCILLAGLLASTQIEGSLTKANNNISSNNANKSRKQTEKDKDDEDDPYPTTTSATANKSSNKLLSLSEALNLLANHFNKPQTPKRTLTALIDVYSTFFFTLGTGFIQDHYQAILNHLIYDLKPPLAPRQNHPLRFDILTHRKHISLLLRDVIGSRILTEQGQITAIREISESYLNTWPEAIPNKEPLSSNSFVILLSELSGLLTQLGSAPSSVQDSLRTPLIRFLTYPDNAVQLAAASALSALCSASPQILSKSISDLVGYLENDIKLLTEPQPQEVNEIEIRVLGRAYGLAALVSLIPTHSLYVSLDVPEKIMAFAIKLLKESGEHELNISKVEIEIAWILVTALMSLGSSFTSSHVNHLQTLWKNALPKPSPKDTATGKDSHTPAEWAFLLHIRQAAVTSILQFLRANAPLLSQDLSRKLVTLLSNGLAFVDNFANQNPHLLHEQSALAASLQFNDRETRLRRRVYQCLVALGADPSTEPLQQSLINTSLKILAEPERYAGSQVQAAIQASSGAFTSLWNQTDGSAYGVTSLLTCRGASIQLSEIDEASRQKSSLTRDPLELEMDELPKTPTRGALEHDWLTILAYGKPMDLASADSSTLPCLPPPESTCLIDSALELFCIHFPLHEASVQVHALQQMLTFYRSHKLDKNPGRKAAILVNSVTAILGCLRSAMHLTSSSHAHGSSAASKVQEAYKSPQLQERIYDVLKEAIDNQDERIRTAAAEALGRMCYLAGTSVMANQIQSCVSQIVNNTDPSSRAGRAKCLSEIYCNVGGMSASSVLKTVVDVLMSLSADPHPVVHYYSLDALSRVINAAGLGYEHFLNGTLGMLAKLYYKDSHEPEGGSPSTVNLRSDLPAYIPFCRILDGLINVLGPELQDSPLRQLVMILSREFIYETDESVHVEALKTMQHLLLFSPDDLDLANLISVLMQGLNSSRRPLKIASINSIYQLVQRNVHTLTSLGGKNIVRDLFALLDDDPTVEGVRATITSWLTQTVAHDANVWVDICQKIVSRVSATRQATDDAATNPIDASKTPQAPGMSGIVGFSDEESQGLGVESSTEETSGVGHGIGSKARIASAIPRWRTQRFALQCLHQVFICLNKNGKSEHFDPVRARKSNLRPNARLYAKVADLIKMAFTASTAQVMEIRLAGLVVLRDVIENFKDSPDTDFEDSLLLEQHQAPIAAALTPAFASDSCPEVLAAAIEICAVFVGSKVVQQVDRMGRILKLLTSSLDSCKNPEMSSLADVQGLCTTSVAMLKTSTFAAWAQLQTASVQAKYLEPVLAPHLSFLCTSWIESLREYARLRVDNNDSSQSTSLSMFSNSMYSGSLTKEGVTALLSQTWYHMLRAVAVLLQSNNDAMIKAVQGLDPNKGSQDAKNDSGPAQFFYIIYGLAYEHLSTSDSMNNPQITFIALEAFRGLARPSVGGDSLLSPQIFSEFSALCFRLIATESCAIQKEVVLVIQELAHNYGKSYFKTSLDESKDAMLQLDSTSLTCLQIIISVLEQNLPKGGLSKAQCTDEYVNEKVLALKTSWIAYGDIVRLHDKSIQEDLISVPFYFYYRLLNEENVEVDLVTPTLPTLKHLCGQAFEYCDKKKSILPRFVQGLLSASLQNVDGTRGRSGSAVTIKTKGNLLAAVVILTSAPSWAKLSRAAVEHCCFLITQLSSSDNTEIALTAIHCAQTFLVSSTRGSAALQYAVGQLTPSLVEHVVTVANGQGTWRPTFNEKDVPTAIFAQILNALESLVDVVPNENRAKVYEILIPTFLALVSTDVSQAGPAHSLSIRKLVSLASKDSNGFKSCTESLDQEKRSKLETAIRKHLQSSSGNDSSRNNPATPTISLKSFG